MYTLYDGLQTGGVSVKAALEEAGIEYRRITVDLQKRNISPKNTHELIRGNKSHP